MTTVDIVKSLKNQKGFNGVYSRDTLPKKINNIENGVINMDLSENPGTHWVCYFNHPGYKYVEYFDSFGFAPGEEIKRFLRTSGKLIQYNDKQFQMENSVLCGYYCLKYIKDRNKNKSPLDIIYSFKQKPCMFNEKLV